jgi:hypothetical protein
MKSSPSSTFTTRLANHRELLSIKNGSSINSVTKGSPGRKIIPKSETPFDGAWLTCYMIRRFGWPNMGGDPYKDLCANWVLTTPMKGLFLNVRPHMGKPNNEWSDLLSFGVCHTFAVSEKLRDDPVLTRFWQTESKAALQWWRTEGVKHYAFGDYYADDADEKCIDRIGTGTNNGKKFTRGFYKKSLKHNFIKEINIKHNNSDSFFNTMYCIRNIIEKNHPEAPMPKWNPEMRKGHPKYTPFQEDAIAALQTTLKDLEKPTYVRDTYFNIHGNVNPNEKTIECDYFKGAGYTPKYWFTKLKERKPKKSLL